MICLIATLLSEILLVLLQYLAGEQWVAGDADGQGLRGPSAGAALVTAPISNSPHIGRARAAERGACESVISGICHPLDTVQEEALALLSLAQDEAPKLVGKAQELGESGWTLIQGLWAKVAGTAKKIPSDPWVSYLASRTMAATETALRQVSQTASTLADGVAPKLEEDHPKK